MTARRLGRLSRIIFSLERAVCAALAPASAQQADGRTNPKASRRNFVAAVVTIASVPSAVIAAQAQSNLRFQDPQGVSTPGGYFDVVEVNGLNCSNLLAISRGKIAVNEVLGSGDASVPNQEFVLKKSPLAYLAKGVSFDSTLAVRVNGRRWQEAKSFYQQPPVVEIFVTYEDEQGNTHVMFGDGVNGARLPTGAGNVVATYRYGTGAKSPRSGEITVINKPCPVRRTDWERR